MRIFENYEDFLVNKRQDENGVTKEFLKKHYGGDINKAEADNKTNRGCFNCNGCTYCLSCLSCVSCIRCASCNNCRECVDSEDCSHCSNCTDCISCVSCDDCTNCERCFDCFARNEYRDVKIHKMEKIGFKHSIKEGVENE